MWPKSPYMKRCLIELTVVVCCGEHTMTPPLHNLRIRIPAPRRPVMEDWIGVPDGTICLLFAAIGLTVMACWLAHIGGIPPQFWWLLFA